MAVQYIGAGAKASGTGAITVNLPANRQTDDLMLLVVETANQAVTLSGADSANWLQLASSPQGTGTAGGTAATLLAVYYRFVDGTEAAITVNDSGDHQVAGIGLFRGVDPAAPFDVQSGGTKATASTTVTYNSVTTTVPDTLVLLIESHALPDSNTDNQTTGWTNSNLTNLGLDFNYNTNAGNGGGFSVASGDKATAGSTGTSSATLSTSSTNGFITLALKPPPRALVLSADSGSYTLTGLAATLLENRFLNLESGFYSLTGLDATLEKSIPLSADSGSYTLTGLAATLLENRFLNLEAGSYSVTGSSATFIKITPVRELLADPGTYSITGSAATLAKDYFVSANAGSYSITGFTAALQKDSILAAEFGVYSITGVNATLIVNTPSRVLAADFGTYALTGSAASIFRNIPFNAEAGSYSLTGFAATILEDFTLAAQAGNYDITGFNAAFSKFAGMVASPGFYDITGSQTSLLKQYLLNAEGATEYVDSGYVDPGYVIQTGYYVNGFPAVFVYPVFPLPNQVLAGVVYGPNGNNYIGTYVCPPSATKQPLYIFDD